MMLLREIRTLFHNELDQHYPKEEVDSFFFMCMGHYLGLERFVLVLHPNYVVSKEGEQQFFKALARLKKEEPIQYILGTAHFMDLSFTVNEHVLIPRPETEELVQWILGAEREQRTVPPLLHGHNVKILDIGTGSGCIAIALAKALPKAQVYALDVSGGALMVARENAQLNEVDVTFFQDDILNLERGSALGPGFDIIVSNPPYVREMEKVKMKNNVKGHEPSIALFVPDGHALKFYEAIVRFSKIYLNPRGGLFLEINQYMAKETRQLLVDNDFRDVELRKDIFGNFRMLKGVMSKK